MDSKLSMDLFMKYCKEQPEVLGGKKRLKLDKSFVAFENAKKFIPGGICGARGPENYIIGEYPIYIESGKYGHCVDLDGNEYVDYMCGYGPVTLGYAMPEIDEAVKKQIDKGFCFTIPQNLQNVLAEKLQEIIPCAEKTIFGKTGTDAVVSAIKVARAYTKKEYILTSGYHGWTDEILSGPDGGALKATRAYTKWFKYGDYEGYEAAVKDGNVAAILISTKTGGPAQGIQYDPEFIRKLRKLASDNDVVLIFDEIRNGFRYGMDGGMTEMGVIPDLAIFGKGIANGYAISALCGKAEMMETCAKEHTDDGAYISSTFFVNTLDMAAALKTIEFYEEHDVMKVMKEKTDYYNNNVDIIIKEHKAPMLNIGYGAQPAFAFDRKAMGEELFAARSIMLFTYIIRSGLLIHPWRQQYFMYSHTKEDIDRSLKALDEGLTLVQEKYSW